MPRTRAGQIQLSPRQAEIVVLVTRGFTDRKIADTLGIAVRTVSNYLTVLYDLTGCENRTQLAVLVGPEYSRSSELPHEISRVDTEDGSPTPGFHPAPASGDSSKLAPGAAAARRRKAR